MRVAPILAGLVVVVAAGVIYLATTADTPEPVEFADADTTLLPPEDRGVMAVAETVQGQLPENGTHLWTFDATAGQSITVRLSTSTRSTVAILPPDDMFSLVQVQTDPADDTAEICAQILPVTGTYTLQVQSDAAAEGDATGPYLVRIEYLGAPTDAPLPATTETITVEGGTMSVVRPPPCVAN